MKWLPLLALFAPIPPVVIGYLLSRRKIQEIHLLVNHRLDEALDKISMLEAAAVTSRAALKEALVSPPESPVSNPPTKTEA